MDWSDHAIWWPSQNKWLDKTRYIKTLIHINFILFIINSVSAQVDFGPVHGERGHHYSLHSHAQDPQVSFSTEIILFYSDLTILYLPCQQRMLSS